MWDVEDRLGFRNIEAQVVPSFGTDLTALTSNTTFLEYPIGVGHELSITEITVAFGGASDALDARFTWELVHPQSNEEPEALLASGEIEGVALNDPYVERGGSGTRSFQRPLVFRIRADNFGSAQNNLSSATIGLRYAE